jgi:hypothetical protein
MSLPQRRGEPQRYAEKTFEAKPARITNRAHAKIDLRQGQSESVLGFLAAGFEKRRSSDENELNYQSRILLPAFGNPAESLEIPTC